MNYFFVPAIKGVETHVTLSTYPPIGAQTRYQKGFYVYAANIQSEKWHIQNMGEIGPDDSVRYEFNEKLLSSFEMPPLVLFLYPDFLPDTLDKLIISPIMNTAVAWRANLKLCSPTTGVSFQGEYPDSMLPIPQGSLTSFCPMIQTDRGLHTKLIVVNIRDIPIQESRDLVILKLRSKEVVDTMTVSTNACNTIDLGDMRYSQDDPIGIFSPNMVGIPLYFTHNDDFSMMSLEHTHPPHSSIFFGEGQRDMVAKMKTYWFNLIADIVKPW